MKANAKQIKRMVELATLARRFAYSPYSRYPVGAAVLTASGRIFSGANVENASYGLSLCAERVAIFNAVTRGEKELAAVCVVARSPRPCGACRQVMLEFSSKETELFCADVADGRRTAPRIHRQRVFSTLPGPFDPLESGLLPPNPQNLLRLKRRRKPRRK